MICKKLHYYQCGSHVICVPTISRQLSPTVVKPPPPSVPIFTVTYSLILQLDPILTLVFFSPYILDPGELNQ